MTEKNTHTTKDDLQDTRWQRDALRLRLAFEAGYITSFEWDIKRDEVRRFISTTPALPLTPDSQPITFHDACQNVYHADRERFIANVQAALEHEQGHYSNEFRVINPENGEILWLHASGRVEFDDQGKPAYLIGFSRDITAQKTAELELRKSQRRYAGIVESAMDAIVTIDIDQRILLFNAAAEKMFGCKAEEVIGHSLERFIPERFQHEHKSHIEKFAEGDVANRKMGGSGFIMGRRANGEEFPVEASISQVMINDEVSFTAILRDVSERKRIEDRRKLAERALREASRRKDEFLAMLAHELRNPLAPISNAVQILRMTQQRHPEIAQTTNMIGRQVKHLIRLVDDLLDVSRVTRGKIKLKKTPLDMAEIMRQEVETIRPQLELRNHRLEVCLPHETIRVEGDATRLAQVISNLLNNAAKYTDAGGMIRLSLEKALSTDVGSEAVIRVKDNGRGMEPAALENLFDMFYQIERNLDRSEGGLGIGLYLVKSLVSMHGGRVSAFSEGRNKGSEFVIRLPCLPEQRQEDQSGNDNTVSHANSKHILVVDDNPDVADSMAMLLRLLGHEVILAYDGKEAVNIALKERPQVVLLDIDLPHLNGYEACRAMRATGLTGTTIIALSGYGQEEDRKKAEEAGFDYHMAKPVDVDMLERFLAS